MGSLLTQRNIAIGAIVGCSALATIGTLAAFKSAIQSKKDNAIREAKEALAKDIYDEETMIKVYKKWSKDLYPVYNVIQIKARELLR